MSQILEWGDLGNSDPMLASCLALGPHASICGLTLLVKHEERIHTVCGGHLISMSFLLGILCLLPKGRWELCLLIGVITLPLLRSRHKNPPIHTPGDLHRFGS